MARLWCTKTIDTVVFPSESEHVRDFKAAARMQRACAHRDLGESRVSIEYLCTHPRPLLTPHSSPPHPQVYQLFLTEGLLLARFLVNFLRTPPIGFSQRHLDSARLPSHYPGTHPHKNPLFQPAVPVERLRKWLPLSLMALEYVCRTDALVLVPVRFCGCACVGPAPSPLDMSPQPVRLIGA